MTAHVSDGPATLRDLRDAFLDDNEWADEGPWIQWVRVGPLKLPVPNPPARQRALRLHDLHHLLTGYDTSWRGEAQMAGWEVGGGLFRNPVAWTMCPFGVAIGLARYPTDTVRAYVRGRQGRTLLGQETRAVYAMSPDDARAFCGVDADVPEPTAGDWARVLAWGAFGAISITMPPVAWALSRFDQAPDARVDDPSRP